MDYLALLQKALESPLHPHSAGAFEQNRISLTRETPRVVARFRRVIKKQRLYSRNGGRFHHIASASANSDQQVHPMRRCVTSDLTMQLDGRMPQFQHLSQDGNAP